jgi:predicted PurR-regulated permease PerM
VHAEFLTAMVNNIGKEQLASVEDIKIGGCGTRMWERGEIAWAANNGLIIVCVGLAIQGCIYFQGFLQPLVVAYFLVFFVTPIMDIFMHRPINVPFSGGAKSCCDLTMEDPDSEEEPKGRMYKSEFRRAVMGKPQGGLYDFLTTCKFPHGITLLLTIVTTFGILLALVLMVHGETSVLLSDDDFMFELRAFVDGLYSQLNESGVNIIRDKTEGYTADEISNMLAQFNSFFGQAALIFLLWVYILSEKTDRLMFGDGGDSGPGILQEAEAQATNYITLKTILSFVTGLVVAVILLILQVKLAVMFGLLSFALNFIPNVGSMIAMFLPLPIVIVDKNLKTWQKIGAFAGPGAVQGYVGNALEPMVFGKSLNMTPLSILMALVLWSALWGIMGAILSVPLLGIQKICMTHANHPLAKYFLTLIVRQPSVIPYRTACPGHYPILFLYAPRT